MDKLHSINDQNTGVLIPRYNLDPVLFDIPDMGQPRLNGQCKVHVLSGVARISSVCPTEWAVIFGKCLTEPDQTTFVNVLVGLDNDRMNKINSMSLNMIIRDLNDKYVVGTRHPIRYILTTEPLKKEEFDQLYAPLDDRWLKYIIRDQYNTPKITPVFLEKKNEPEENSLTTGKVPFIAAKEANSGVWPITIGQAQDLVDHFKTNMPKRGSYIKMLGNTKVMLYRPKRDKFFLLKGEALEKKVKKKIHLLKIKQGMI